MTRRPLPAVALLTTLTAATAFAAPAPYLPLTAPQLDQLTAPIALYPDPLLAQLLPAATYPLDLVTASQWLAANPSPTSAAIASQPWDNSVQSLLRYPTVLTYLASNLAWTRQLGDAYLNQPADVMAAIQRLRHRARAAGNLFNNGQQVIVILHDQIEILPATPDTLYVPTYDPNLCYTRRSPIHFSNPCPTGPWLDNDTDWTNQYITTNVEWTRDHWTHLRHPDLTPHPTTPSTPPTPTPAHLNHALLAPHQPAPVQWTRKPEPARRPTPSAPNPERPLAAIDPPTPEPTATNLPTPEPTYTPPPSQPQAAPTPPAPAQPDPTPAPPAAAEPSHSLAPVAAEPVPSVDRTTGETTLKR